MVSRDTQLDRNSEKRKKDLIAAIDFTDVFGLIAAKMLKIKWWPLALSVILTFTRAAGQSPTLISEEEMQSLLAQYNSKATEYCHRSTEASWDVATDVGNQTKVDTKVMYHFAGKYEPIHSLVRCRTFRNRKIRISCLWKSKPTRRL